MASLKAGGVSNIEIKIEQKSREDRLAQLQEKWERIVHYLRHGKHLDGLTKNQQKVVPVELFTWDGVQVMINTTSDFCMKEVK